VDFAGEEPLPCGVQLLEPLLRGCGVAGPMLPTLCARLIPAPGPVCRLAWALLGEDRGKERMLNQPTEQGSHRS